MSFINVANNLRAHGLHMVSNEIKLFLSSDAYLKSIKEVDGSDVLKAKLTINMIRSTALSTREGYETPEDCYYEDEEGNAFFTLHFHRLTNPIGSFSLTLDDPLFQLVLDAIDRNVKSRMYKAAELTVRLERLSVKAQVRYRVKANAAYKQTLSENQPSDAMVASFDPDRFVVEAKATKLAEAAYDKVLNSNQTRLFDRLRAVGRVAMPDTELGYTVWLAEFLDRKSVV